MNGDCRSMIASAKRPAELNEAVAQVRAKLNSSKNSLKNCVTVLQYDPLLSGAIKFNVLTQRIDIVKPLGWNRESSTLTDTDMKYLLLYLEEEYGIVNEKKIEHAVRIVANENRYHPIREYLSGLKWDGQERIRYALAKFLGAPVDEYTHQALKLFMLGAICRVFQPGCKFDVMLVWWVVRAQVSPPSSGCWQSGMSGSPMICGVWMTRMFIVVCRAIGLSRCPKCSPPPMQRVSKKSNPS